MKKASSHGRLEQDEADQATASTRLGDQAAPTTRTSTTTPHRNSIGSTRRQSGGGLSQQNRRSSNHGSADRRSNHATNPRRRSGVTSCTNGGAMDTSAGDDINLEKLVAMRHGPSFVRNPQRNSNQNNAGTINNTGSTHILSSIVSGSAGEDFDNSFAIDDGHAYDAAAAVANANTNNSALANNDNNTAPLQRQLTPPQPGAFHRQGPRVYSRGKGTLTASSGNRSNGDADDDDIDIGSTTQQQADSGQNQGALDSSQEQGEEASQERPRPPAWIQMTEAVPANNTAAGITNDTAAAASSEQIDPLDLEKMMIARHGTSIVRNSVTAANISSQVAASLEQPQINQATSGEMGTEVGVEQHPAVGVPVRDGRSSRVSPRDCAVGIVAAQPAAATASSSTGKTTGTANRSIKKKKRAVRVTSNNMDASAASAKSMDTSTKSSISAKRAALLPLMLEHQENAGAEQRRREEERRNAARLGDNSGNSAFHDIEEGNDYGDDSRSRQSRQSGDDSSTRDLVRAREVTGESMQDLVLGEATPINSIGEGEGNKTKFAAYLSKRVRMGACLLLCVVIIAVVVAVWRGGGTEIVTRTEAPTAQPTVAPTVAATDLVVLDLPESTVQAITMDKTSPQALAYQWLLGDPQWPLYEQGRLLQRFVLATLYFSTNAPTRDQSHWKIDTNWLSLEHHECSWGYRGEEDVIEPCMDLYTQAVSDNIQNILLVSNGLKGTCKYR